MLAKTPKTPHPLDLHVARRLKSARVRANISQEKAADALGLTFQQVQKYEKGTNRIAPARLVGLARLYHVPVSYFFEGLEEGEDNSAARDICNELLTTAMGDTLATNFLAIQDNATKAIVVAMVAKLAGAQQ